MEKNLKQSERIFVTGILLLMLSIVVIGKINSRRTSSIVLAQPIPSHEPCKVVIKGEVMKPGTFSVMPGTLLSKVIKKSSPTPFADLKKINMDERVEKSLTIIIEPLTEITVTIAELNHNPIQVTVPAGTRACHLKKYLELTDCKIFKSRRFLKDQETILIENSKELAHKS
jgi:hypothetical protein